MNGKQIVFLGQVTPLTQFVPHFVLTSEFLLRFGIQGSAQAQNLRDSGVANDSILIANLEDSYAQDAKSKGFNVTHDFEAAAKVADGEINCSGNLIRRLTEDLYCIVLFVLIPDQVQPRVFNEKFAPSLKPDVTVVVASGYNVFYNLLKFAPTQNVVMVAPR